MVATSSNAAEQKAVKDWPSKAYPYMIDFKNLFRFSKKEVSCAFEHSTQKQIWRGLKLLQAPLNCLDPSPGFGKLLIITPASSGKAYQRNQFRRRVKNIFYSKKLYLAPIVSILIVNKYAMELEFDQIAKFLEKNLMENL
jgi:ribonuclease P protein component